MSGMRGLLLAYLMVSSQLAVAIESLRGLANTWSPYVDENLPAQGFAVELASHILTRAGYELQLQVGQLPRDSEISRVNNVDVLVALWSGGVRLKNVIYSRPYLLAETLVVTRSDNTRKYFSIGNLKGGRIGVLEGYDYGVDFSEIADTRLIIGDSVHDNLGALLAGDLDYLVADRRVIARNIQHRDLAEGQGLRVLPISLPPRPLSIAASRDNPRSATIIKAFESALIEVKRDTSYQQIVHRWNTEYSLD